MRTYLLLILLGLQSLSSKANNIQLNNLATTFNSTSGVVTVDFDLSWENSWRTTAINNWDAAWVFFKYNDGGIWYHLDLTGFDITLPSGFTYSVPADKKGVFIYRDASNLGVGNVSLTGCKVGVQPQLGSFDLKAFALEMVYVPIGGFYVGDGVTTGSYQDGSSGNPFYVSGGGNFVTMGTASGNLKLGVNGTSTITLNNSYPTGYYPFYLMKYELSTGAFRDFLNCLEASQQRIALTLTNGLIDTLFLPVGTSIFPNTSNFNNFICFTSGGSSINGQSAVFGCNCNGNSSYNEIDDCESVPMGGISPMVYQMYLVFAALRPLTDLEYEKACRGPLNPLPGQYAWGNASITNSGTPTLTNPRRSNEVISGGTLNCNLNNSFLRPLRNGIFATSTSSRVSSGAGYYGAMELTGSLLEFTYIPRITGVSGTFPYAGQHGNGNLIFNISTTNFNQSIPWENLTGTQFYNNFHTVTYNNFLVKGGAYRSEVSTITQGYGKVSFLSTFWAVDSGSPIYKGFDLYGIRGARTDE